MACSIMTEDLTEFDRLFQAQAPEIKGTLHDHHPLLRDWYLEQWREGGEVAVKAFTIKLLGIHADWQYAMEAG